jgi:hypothetical protein
MLPLYKGKVTVAGLISIDQYAFLLNAADVGRWLP